MIITFLSLFPLGFGKNDTKPAIVHNKVMIIDEKEVITGSFNFTDTTQKRNAENLVFITDTKLTHEYIENWEN